MAKQNNKAATRKLRSSYFTTTVSIALVLFLLGMIGLLVLNAGRLSTYVKENLGLTVMLYDDAREAEVRKMEKALSASAMVKSVSYLDKERAAEQMKEELGEDFVEFLGYNPLLSSIDVKLYADYATPEGMQQVERLLMLATFRPLLSLTPLFSSVSAVPTLSTVTTSRPEML